MEERYLTQLDINPKLERAIYFAFAILLIQFKDNMPVFIAINIIFIAIQVCITRIRMRPIFVDEGEHLVFYRGGRVVFKVLKNEISSLSIVRNSLMLPVVEIWLKGRELHLVKLPLSAYPRLDSYKSMVCGSV